MRALSHADLEADLAMQRSDRVARFVAIAHGGHSPHAHLTCDPCGRLYCLPAKRPRAAGLPGCPGVSRPPAWT
jgi:hypothetical protein